MLRFHYGAQILDEVAFTLWFLKRVESKDYYDKNTV